MSDDGQTARGGEGKAVLNGPRGKRRVHVLDGEATSLRPVNRRDQILEAAIDAFAARGYSQTGMHDIGVAAGVTGPAIYRHFDSKSALLVAIFDGIMDELIEEIDAILPAGRSPLHRLLLLVDFHINFVFENQEHIAVIQQEESVLPEDARRRFRLKQRLYLEKWQDVLKGHRSELSDDEAHDLVLGGLALLNRFASTRARLPNPPLKDLLARSVIAALLA